VCASGGPSRSDSIACRNHIVQRDVQVTQCVVKRRNAAVSILDAFGIRVSAQRCRLDADTRCDHAGQDVGLVGADTCVDQMLNLRLVVINDYLRTPTSVGRPLTSRVRLLPRG
jgi:hypothetical protein